MKNKKLFILAGILVVLVALALTYNHHRQTAKPESYFKEFKPEAITKVEMIKKGQTVALEKSGAAWQVKAEKTWPANKMLVDELLNSLKDLTIGSIVSTNPQRQAEFQVDNDNGISLKVFKGSEQVLDIIVGKVSSDYLHGFLKFPGKNEVYQGIGAGRWIVERDAKAWRDRTIVSVNEKEVDQITITGKEKTSLFQKGGVWRLNDPDKGPETNPINVNQYTAVLCSLTADDFIDEPKADAAYGFDKPTLTLFIKMKDKSEHSLILGNSKKENDQTFYYLKKKDNPVYFRIAKYTFDLLNKASADFKK
jgi:hypothetical protein